MNCPTPRDVSLCELSYWTEHNAGNENRHRQPSRRITTFYSAYMKENNTNLKRNPPKTVTVCKSMIVSSDIVRA